MSRRFSLDDLPGRSGPIARALLPAVAILVFQMVCFPLTLTGGKSEWGVYLQGVTFGLLTALMALGMALVYRANRMINFAQADLGIVPAILSVNLITLSGLNYFAAFGVGLVASVFLGGLVELAIIRRFFEAPRLILTVATIGLSQLLAFLALGMSGWLWHDIPSLSPIDQFPIDWKLSVDPVLFRTEYFLVWLIAPGCMLAVGFFLRFTDVGVAVRASAERAERALLLGIPVKRLHTYVWAVAGSLSFIALFLRAGLVGVPLGPALGLSVLLAALAALTIGKLENIAVIMTTAVSIGVLTSAIRWKSETSPLGLFTIDTSSEKVVSAVLGLVIVVALIAQKVGESRASRDTSSTWRSADEVRPIPSELRRLPEVMLARWGAFGLLTVFALALPHYFNWRGLSGDVSKATAVLLFSIIGLSIVVLTGWAGQVSLGQLAFAAVGGAVGAKATGEWGLDLTLAVFVAGLAGAVIAVFVGLPALRLRGLYLAVTTLAFALAATQYFLDPSFFEWVPSGSIDRPDLFGRWSIDTPTRFYYVALTALVMTLVALSGIRRSRTGRVLVAMRENEAGVEAYGISVVRVKLSAFALSGFFAAVAGAILVHQQRGFSLVLFKPEDNLVVFSAAVVGGLGSLAGGVLGAVFLQGGEWFITDPKFRLLVSGMGVLLVLWLAPGGLGGIMFRGRDNLLRLAARRRGIVVASLLADSRVEPGPDLDLSVSPTSPEVDPDEGPITEADLDAASEVAP